MVIASNTAHASDTIKLLLIGDSIASGYGLPDDDGFASRLEAKLHALASPVEIKNYGIAGATSQSALAIIDGADFGDFDAVLIELGANDILRGVNPNKTRHNLMAITAYFNTPIYIIGMRAPRQYGSEFVDAFDSIYTDLARDHGVGLYPFLFERIYSVDDGSRHQLFQSDGIHLSAGGVDLVTQDIAVDLATWLKRVGLLHP